MADERKWVPDFLFDEVSPSPRPHPDHWLIAEDVTAPGWWVTDPDDDQSASERIDIGGTMAFSWFIDHGELVFTISRDGSFTTNRPIPAEANCFCQQGDADTLDPTPDGFARNWAENTFSPADAETYGVVVWAYQWSERPVTFRLGLVEGKPHFEEIGHE